MHGSKRAGKLVREWKENLAKDGSANVVIITGAGAKRKAVSMPSS
jgi:hypothetical protein